VRINSARPFGGEKTSEDYNTGLSKRYQNVTQNKNKNKKTALSAGVDDIFDRVIDVTNFLHLITIFEAEPKGTANRPARENRVMLRDGSHLEKICTSEVFEDGEPERAIALGSGSIAGSARQPGGTLLLQPEHQGPHVAGVEPADDGGGGVGLGGEDVGCFKHFKGRRDGGEEALLYGTFEDWSENFCMDMFHDREGVSGVFGGNRKVEDTDTPGSSVLLQIVELLVQPEDLGITVL